MVRLVAGVAGVNQRCTIYVLGGRSETRCFIPATTGAGVDFSDSSLGAGSSEILRGIPAKPEKSKAAGYRLAATGYQLNSLPEAIEFS